MNVARLGALTYAGPEGPGNPEGLFSPRLWSKAQVANAVKKGVITASDYEEITGEVYEGV